MEPFPELKNNEVVVVRCDSNTGHVLDDKFVLAISDDQKVFTVFETLEVAKSYIAKEKSRTESIDFVIYRSENIPIGDY
ncbi:hypothetical protein SDC9_83068 [bioreactor metagenome]|uniref:Uncharacterized protein n=1 Tax=bioreactor metagenome TaxID=1076179 RepID=A0A644Z903_9ZZZZ